MALLDRLKGSSPSPAAPHSKQPENGKRTPSPPARDALYQDLKSRVHNRLFEVIDFGRISTVSEDRVCTDIATATVQILEEEKFLLTLEERYFTDLKPFGLFRVGWAVFFDVGKARFRDAAPAWVPELSGDHFDTLFDVGVGLRLESVRTRRDRVIHFDIAKPLVDGPGVDSFEVTITSKRSF